MFAKLSLFWFWYFAGLGIFFPFFGLYLQQDMGLSPSRVGWILACIPWVGWLVQPIWGRISDHTGSRRRALALALAGAALLYAVLGVLPTFGALLAGTLVLACFSTGVVPLGVAVSMAALGEQAGELFGRVRLWGTVGFLLAVLGLPKFLEVFEAGLGPWQGLGIIFPLVAFCTLLAAPAILRLPASRGLELKSLSGDTRRLLRHGPVARLLVLAFVTHLFIQAPIQLFPLLVTERGGDASWISEMWVYMLLLEIPLIGGFGRVLRRLGIRYCLVLGLLAEGLRWTSTAWMHDFQIFRWIQLLHGIGVAGLLVGYPVYLEQCVPERSRATAQSLLAVAAGAGTIVSVAVGGWVMEIYRADTLYYSAGFGCLVLAALLPRVLPLPRRAASFT